MPGRGFRLGTVGVQVPAEPVNRVGDESQRRAFSDLGKLPR